MLSTQGLRSPRGPGTGLRGQGEQAEGAGLALGRQRGARNSFHFHIYVNASKFSPSFIFYFFLVKNGNFHENVFDLFSLQFY